MPNRFYLSTYLGVEKGMGTMQIWLSDGLLTRMDSSVFRRMLAEGDVVLSECEPRARGVYTLAIAKVEGFREDGITPLRLKCVWGRDISLSGNEEIIDHRKGHTKDCSCGA